MWVLADLLVQKGKGSQCRIVELGPGKGTLAKDIIKVYKTQCSINFVHSIVVRSSFAHALLIVTQPDVINRCLSSSKIALVVAWRSI